MKVLLTPRAQQDMRSIDRYLRERSLQGAEGVARRIRAALFSLSVQPHLGTATENPGVRQLFIGRYPYIACYRILAEHIEVLHIRHTSRRPVDLSRFDI